jgi:hypothetical protein
LSNPAGTQKVVHSTIEELLKILESRTWIILELEKPDCILAIDNRMTCLRFSFAHMGKVVHLGPRSDPKLQMKIIIAKNNYK